MFVPTDIYCCFSSPCANIYALHGHSIVALIDASNVVSTISPMPYCSQRNETDFRMLDICIVLDRFSFYSLFFPKSYFLSLSLSPFFTQSKRRRKGGNRKSSENCFRQCDRCDINFSSYWNRDEKTEKPLRIKMY